MRHFSAWTSLVLVTALVSSSLSQEGRTPRDVAAELESRRQAGDYAGALDAARELLRLREQTPDTPAYRVVDAADQVQALEAIVSLPPAAQDSLRVADGLTRSYRIALSQGRYQEALALTRRQLAMRRNALGRPHPDIGFTLVYQVLALQKAGHLEGAEEAARQTVLLMMDLHGRDHVGTATALNNLADVLRQRGDFVAAEALHREALATQRRILGEGHPFLSVTLNNLGALHMEQGEWSEAEERFREAADLEKTRRGEDHPNVALALKNLAMTLQQQDRFAEAETLLIEARAIYEKEYGPRHRRVARLQADLGALRDQQGDAERARELYESSLALYLELVGEHQDPVADLRNRLGRLSLAAAPDRARELHAQALSTYQELYGERHPRMVETLVDLAAAERRLGARDRADELLRRAADSYEAARLRATGLRRATLPIPSPYPLMAAVALEQRREADAWTFAEQARGRVLGEILVASRDALDTPLAATRDSLLRRVTRVEGDLAALRTIDAETSADRIEAKRQELLEAEAAWSRFQMARAERTHPAPLRTSVADVQKTLTTTDALVGWLDADDAAGSVASYGFVIRSTGPVQWFPVAPGTETRALRASLRGDEASALGVEMTDEDVRVSHEVWRQRIAPIEDALAGADRLIVIPSGPLLGVPVEALIDDEGRPLVERFAVVYAPSATTHALLAGSASAGEMEAALLLGDPPFRPEHLQAMQSPPTTMRVGAARLQRLPRLRWTRAEVEKASAFFAQPTVLLGPEANEATLQTMAGRGDLARFGVLHLATHALPDASRPERSALILAQTGLPDPVTALLEGRPLYDGVITAGDIARGWRLQSDLVTLSACGTGLGRDVAGEGILGLAHAFFQAGSHSLLVSLWEVDDEATALLMEGFYRNWTQHGLDKAEALREAKRWLRNTEDDGGYRPYEHPYHWAAFVLMGNGR